MQTGNPFSLWYLVEVELYRAHFGDNVLTPRAAGAQALEAGGPELKSELWGIWVDVS